MIRKLTQKKKKRDEEADEFVFEVPQNHSQTHPQKPARSLPTNAQLPKFKDIYEEPLYIRPQKK